MAFTDITDKVKTTRPAIPQIYAYTTPEIARHSGWTKIGYTEQNVHVRIKQQTQTVDVNYHLEWQGNAIYEDGSGTFRDTDFHAYLRKLGYQNRPKTEWFAISGGESKNHFRDFRENRGVIQDKNGSIEYRLRDEQNRAIQAALNYVSTHSGGEFLWNAKPRFGKTLTSYDFCLQLDAKKILIVTNRPAIANSWYDDYVKFVGQESGLCFISSVNALQNKLYCLSHEQYLENSRNSGNGSFEGFIEFVSLQDLKGSIEFGGKYDNWRTSPSLTGMCSSLMKHTKAWTLSKPTLLSTGLTATSPSTCQALPSRRSPTKNFRQKRFSTGLTLTNNKPKASGTILNCPTRTQICRNSTCSPTG